MIFHSGLSFQTPLAWLGEFANNQIWHSPGEILIGNYAAQTACEVFGLCPQFEKGAEMDHVDIGAQRNCIWKANFPGC